MYNDKNRIKLFLFFKLRNVAIFKRMKTFKKITLSVEIFILSIFASSEV